MGTTNKEYQRSSPSHRYLPGLDGFRGIAVIAIIIFHLNALWLPGGFLGVDTFFVISGYLITSLLLTEYDRDGSISLLAFWVRRVKRLIPAVLFLLAVTLTYTIIFEPKLIISLKQDVVAALFYVSNWWYIFQHVDYFDQFTIQPLKHLWSLAIEEQFYLLYPILLLGLLKLTRRKWILWTFVGVSLLSLVLMVILIHSGHHISRVYFGTDTRLQTLLIGAMLAIIWPPFRLKANIPLTIRSIIDVMGLVSFAGLMLLMYMVNEQSMWLYNWGFYAIALLTLFIIASAVHPSGYFAKLMGNPVFVFIGKRSYSLYLWHYPVIMFVHTHFVQGQIPFYAYVLDILLMLLMTQISYHFIERPFRKEGFKAFALSPKQHQRFSRLTLVLVLLIPTILLFSGNFDARGHEYQNKHKTSFTSADKKGNQTQKSKTAGTAGNDKKAASLKPLFIGDSIMVDIGSALQKKMPDATIDGKVGRQFSEAQELSNSHYHSFAQPDKQVVIELAAMVTFHKSNSRRSSRIMVKRTFISSQCVYLRTMKAMSIK